MSTTPITEINFLCTTCNKIPPPLSPAIYNSSRSYLICADFHVVCHNCFIHQETYFCRTCSKKKETQLLMFMDPIIQPRWLKQSYKKVIAKTTFDCARQCGTQLPVGGQALLEHEEECTFDPPCVCPMCDSYTFFWPKNDSEKAAILKEHGHHLDFVDGSRYTLMLEDIYDLSLKTIKANSKCTIFEPVFDYVHCSTADSYKVDEVKCFTKRFPYIAIWFTIDGNTNHELKVKWLQDKTRIIPDASYTLFLSLVHFHTYCTPHIEALKVNITKPSERNFQRIFYPSFIERTLLSVYNPCTTCNEKKKHFHVSCNIVNTAISECKTRFYI